MSTNNLEAVFSLSKSDAKYLKKIINTWWQLHRLRRKGKIMRMVSYPFIVVKWRLLGWFMIKCGAALEETVEYYIANYMNIKIVRHDVIENSDMVNVVFVLGNLKEYLAKNKLD
jgi:hypothetical protein